MHPKDWFALLMLVIATFRIPWLRRRERARLDVAMASRLRDHRQLSEVIVEDPPDVASDEPEECTCENNGDPCEFCLARDAAQHEYLYSPEWKVSGRRRTR